MCGIAGYISTKSDGRLREIIQAMTDSVSHRGPDGEGVFVEGNVALGHRRLAIIDLSELGAQPMSDPDSGCVIVYNGEIYNYIEVRKELASRGCSFKSHSDTEVILKAYDVWGADCVSRFKGICDPRSQEECRLLLPRSVRRQAFLLFRGGRRIRVRIGDPPAPSVAR
jgi:asparagine synthase (glutamine-hydrolysing)